MLIGNLGADAETRYTGGGTPVTNFRIATSRSVKDGQTGEYKDEVDWHNVVLWNGEKVVQYLTKGTKVYIEGRLQTRSWEDQDGNKRYQTEVVVNGFDLMLLGGQQQSSDYAPRAARPGPQPVPPPPPDDDDVPF